MSIDNQYQKYWTKHVRKPPFPKGYVLPVHHTIQGHPKSPRLWVKYINNILQGIGFKSTTHKCCIYQQIKVKQHQDLFLRQFDDFAIASKNSAITTHIIAQIGSKLQVPINHYGVIAGFNSIDVLQTKSCIKVVYQTYLNKVLDGHN